MEKIAHSCTPSIPRRQLQQSRMPTKDGKPLHVHSVLANFTLSVDIVIGTHVSSAMVMQMEIILPGHLSLNQYPASLMMINPGPPVWKTKPTTIPMQIHLRRIMAGVLQRLQTGTCLQTRTIIAHGTVQAGMIITSNPDHKNPVPVSDLPREIALEVRLAGIHMTKNFRTNRRVQKPRRLRIVDGHLRTIQLIQYPGVPRPLPNVLITSKEIAGMILSVICPTIPKRNNRKEADQKKTLQTSPEKLVRTKPSQHGKSKGSRKH